MGLWSLRNTLNTLWHAFNFSVFTTAGRYVARKIASAFSRPNRQARSAEAMDESPSVPTASQKHPLPAVTDTNNTLSSAYEWKETEYSNGTINRVNGEGTARQRAF